MTNCKEDDFNNLSDIDWEEDAFDLSASQIEDQRGLIAESNNLGDDDTPSKDHLETLQKCFGHKSFRPMQWKIISSIINHKRDNCAVMATGYGKSLCFQYPSVYCGGLTLVISPLISLMEDQVLSLTMANIPACFLGSAQTKQKQVIKDILEDKYSLVYLTPEFASGDYGAALLKEIDSKVSITLIAIDEAHCVSTWGHDFRFQYRELGKLRSILPHVPILAVTATATARVRSDIVKSLKLKNAQVLCSGFDRPNLYFSVFLKGNRGAFAELQKYMVKENNRWTFTGSTIIYCITRKQTEDLAQLLNVNGIKCAAYHGSMSVKARTETHEQFVKDKIKVIVATIAFGMGIDKPDVRRIIHYGSSKDLESYYQEVGRAGRDGQPAECVTFYSNGDFDVLRHIRENGYGSEKNKAHKEAMAQLMVKYFDTRECRRQFILNHFEGTPHTKREPKPRCCDNCTRKLTETDDSKKYEGLDSEGRYDFTQDAHAYLSAVNAMNGRFGLGSYVLFLRGSKSSKISRFQAHPLHGSGKSKSEEWWKAIGIILQREKFLQKNAGGDRFVATMGLSGKGQMFLEDIISRPHQAKLLLPPTQEIFKMLKVKEVKRAPLPKPVAVERQISRTQRESSSSPLQRSKPSLKKLQLLKAPAMSQSVIGETEIDEPNVEEETAQQKEERMKIFRMLTNKRQDIAAKMDCMPYMVASNEALMKMAQHKPLTLSELRNCQLEGFNEAKLKKFGPELVRTMRLLCNLNPDPPQEEKRTIEDILIEHPLPGAKISNSALITHSHFKEGLSISEIATKRGIVIGTVMSHLTDGIKMGYPIKIIDMNITDDDRNTIISIIKGPKINSDMSALTPIKMACPEHITFDVIKAVIGYVQVREHLKSLNIPYEEFDEPYDDILSFATMQNKTLSQKSALDELVSIGNDLLEKDNNAEVENVSCSSPSLLTMSQTRKRNKSECDEDMERLLETPPLSSPKRVKRTSSFFNKKCGESDSDVTIIEESPEKNVGNGLASTEEPLKCRRRRIIENSESDNDDPNHESTQSSKNQDELFAEELLADKSFDDCDFDNIDKDIEQHSPKKIIIPTKSTSDNKDALKDKSCEGSIENNSGEESASKKLKQFKFKKVDKKVNLPSWLSKDP